MRFRLGSWLVRPDMDDLVQDGQASHISPKSMEVLICLARRQGQVVGKEQIVEEVWKGTFVSDDSLTRCIAELRRAFHDDAREPAIIRTISKRGYLLLPAVAWETAESAPGTAPSGSGASDGGVTPRLPGIHEPESAHAPPPQSTVRGRRWKLVAGCLVLLGAILLVVYASRWRARSSAGVTPTIRCIAVLPLANLSGDPEQEYFADGMTEQLITELAQITAWQVISRTSVMRYKKTQRPLRQIARDLAVDGLIEGTVLRSGTRVRVTAQLIDAATDRHLWSGSFEREMQDVLSLQAGIARTIAGQLNLTLAPREQVRLRLGRKVVPEAYEAYLRGWYFFDRGQYAKAASHFEQATFADPGFALAYALLGEAEGMAAFARDLPLPNRALRAVERARQLDDTLAEVHDLQGDAMFGGNWDWEAGAAEYRRAVELDPGSVDAALHYAYCLHALTRWRAAEQELTRALRLDPVSPAVNLEILRLLVDTDRHEAALEQFRKVVDLDPNSAGAYSEIALVYAALGRERDAVRAFLRSQDLAGSDAEKVSELAASAEHGGFRGCLRKRIEQLNDEAKSGHVSPLTFAGTYAWSGDNHTALTFVEAAYRQHLARMMWIKARATWSPLRSEPDFQALLRRMRFPE